LTRKGEIDRCYPALLKGDQRKGPVTIPIGQGRLATTKEIARVGDGGAPVIGKALKVVQAEPLQILASDTDNAKLTECTQQDTCLIGR